MPLIIRVTAVVALLAVSAPAAATGVLVVPSNDAAVEAGVRAGLGAVSGVEVADAAAVAALIEGARSAGIACAADDGACFLRLAALGGLDVVVFVAGASVTRVTAKQTTAAPTLGVGEAAWAAACRRAFGLESALRLRGAPVGAAVTIDGEAFVAEGADIVREGVAAGAHVVAISAAGYVPAQATVTVTAGSIADVELALVKEAATPSPSATSSPLPAVLRYGGLGVVGAGVVVGAVIAGVGYVEGGCTSTLLGDDSDGCTDKAVADPLSLQGIVVGAVIGVVGAAAFAASFFLE